MGCCGSKETHDEDDVNAPLLRNELSDSTGQMNYNSYDTIDVKKEQEFWNDIIERTTHNLIDISSTQADPLQSQDVEERAERYNQLLRQLPDNIPATTTSMNGTTSSSTISSVDILALARPYQDTDDVKWLSKAMSDIQKSIDKIEVEPVGDIVVNLTLTDNVYS
ncbi:hypothetical protein BDA99DRAFT_504801 [Phascolomyces articulosus]|uniref:Late endosomal/lysosomal adaptor and MAPK and MTOR activator 1 n=1 Tax=Phascolomyces articulosus TaxID=60185 RepID=A0AAD5KCZ0_9FUNG|nr:hypothetical protein BDA99DRAFT_504801 [Phascolomyces articulosus]